MNPLHLHNSELEKAAAAGCRLQAEKEMVSDREKLPLIRSSGVKEAHCIGEAAAGTWTDSSTVAASELGTPGHIEVIGTRYYYFSSNGVCKTLLSPLIGLVGSCDENHPLLLPFTLPAEEPL